MSETRLAPRLVVSDVTRALAFYRSAFGAVEVACHRDGEGKVAHAEVTIDGQPVYLKDADRFDPVGSGVLVSLTVPDSDAVFAAAVAAGAEVIFPLATQFYGERGGRVRDPFGVQWLIATVVEALGDEEMDRRMAEYTG